MCIANAERIGDGGYIAGSAARCHDKELRFMDLKWKGMNVPI